MLNLFSGLVNLLLWNCAPRFSLCNIRWEFKFVSFKFIEGLSQLVFLINADNHDKVVCVRSLFISWIIVVNLICDIKAHIVIRGRVSARQYLYFLDANITFWLGFDWKMWGDLLCLSVYKTNTALIIPSNHVIIVKFAQVSDFFVETEVRGNLFKSNGAQEANQWSFIL